MAVYVIYALKKAIILQHPLRQATGCMQQLTRGASCNNVEASSESQIGYIKCQYRRGTGRRGAPPVETFAVL